jgi:hypothetical protein
MRLLALILILMTCIGCGANQKIKINAVCTVVDMDNKPVKNRKIDLFSILNGHNFQDSFTISKAILHQTKVTNDSGVVEFDYVWQNDESSTTFFHIVAKEDSFFRAVNHLTPQIPSLDKRKEDFKGTIKMDSLVPIKIRFKTNRSDADELKILIMNDPYLTTPQDLTLNPRKFIDKRIKITATTYDTTITTQVYKKADFMSWNIMFFKNTPTTVGNKLVLMKKDVDRNAVFLQEF